MVDINNDSRRTEPDFGDPVTSLNLSFATQLDCWPDLKSQWSALAKDVGRFVQAIADKPEIESSPIPQLFSSSIENFFMLKMLYIGRETEFQVSPSEVSIRGERMFRDRIEKKLEALDTYLQEQLASPSAPHQEELKMAGGISAKIRDVYEGICQALDKQVVAK